MKSGAAQGAGAATAAGAGEFLTELDFIAIVLLVWCACAGFCQFIGKLLKRSKRQRTRTKKHERVLKQIATADPTFDETIFLRHFRDAFVAIQTAWTQQDMSAVKHFVTDGLCEKFSVQFREQQLQRYHEQLDQITIADTLLAHFESQGPFDVLTVQVRASMIDRRISSLGNHIGGNSTPESFTEFWSFVRRRAARGQPNRGSLAAGQCPNCGAVLKLTQFGKCIYCDSLVRSGWYDWVLSEITQTCEWIYALRPSVKTNRSWYRLQHDASFSAQHLEDRAAVIFARKVMADLLGDLAPLRKMAAETFCAACQSHQQPTLRGDCSIGSLHLLGVLAEPEKHYALVEVCWSGRLFDRATIHQLHTGKDWKRFRSLMVLSRQAGVCSNIETALQSAHCPSCGAAEEDLTVDACPACNAVTNTGRYDWVLAEFTAADSSIARKLREHLSAQKQHASPPNSLTETETVVVAETKSLQHVICDTDCLIWAIGVVTNNGILTATTRQTLAQLANKNRIQADLVAGWIEDALAGRLERLEPGDSAVTEAWLKQMISLAIVDGQLEGHERALLSELAATLQLSHYDLDLVIKKQIFDRQS